MTTLTFALDNAQVLRPGGRFLCLEFSHVVLPGLKELYETYSFNVIPQIGRWACTVPHIPSAPDSGSALVIGDCDLL